MPINHCEVRDEALALLETLIRLTARETLGGWECQACHRRAISYGYIPHTHVCPVGRAKKLLAETQRLKGEDSRPCP